MEYIKVGDKDFTPDGRKLSRQHVAYVPNGNGGNRRISSTDLYVDGLILRGGKPLMWQFDGGYVDLDENGSPTGWNYYVTDHLGSTRKVVGSDNTVRETINYYPFGSEMTMQDPSQMSNNFQHPYRFTGKELDRLNGLNMYDFGARWYDVAGVPMWTSVDPLAEKYYNVSPYAYCMNNPVKFVDPDGRTPRIYIDGTGLGHAFVTIGEGENSVVYTYGRYGALGSSGSILRSGVPSGEGVLIKKTGKEAQKYLNEELEKGDLSVYTINNSKDENVADFFDALWDKGTHPTDEKKKSYKDPNAKVVDDYNLFSNNCTTKTISSINNKNSNTRVPTTQRVRRSYYVYPVSYSYYADEKIYDPKVLKVKLEEMSKKYPKDVIKIKDPEQFIKSLGL